MGIKITNGVNPKALYKSWHANSIPELARLIQAEACITFRSYGTSRLRGEGGARLGNTVIDI